VTEITNAARDKLATLEAQLLKVPQVECPIKHYFAPGLYAREISIPAGTVVVGAIHKTENLIVVSKGRLRMVTDDGTQEVAAGETFTCRVGIKNAVYAIENSRWTNFMHNPDNITDMELLAELFTESKASDFLGGSTNLQIVANKAAESIEA